MVAQNRTQIRLRVFSFGTKNCFSVDFFKFHNKLLFKKRSIKKVSPFLAITIELLGNEDSLQIGRSNLVSLLSKSASIFHPYLLFVSTRFVKDWATPLCAALELEKWAQAQKIFITKGYLVSGVLYP